MRAWAAWFNPFRNSGNSIVLKKIVETLPENLNSSSPKQDPIQPESESSGQDTREFNAPNERTSQEEKI